MATRDDVLKAIRESWSTKTCPEELWAEDNPARGQCDASSFVAWQYLGGELVLSQVVLDGKQVEHHYWNRINGEDIDLTREQFQGGEEFVEIDVLSDRFLAENMTSMKPEVLARVAKMRELVAARLDERPSRPKQSV